jgi:hypothetical protein
LPASAPGAELDSSRRCAFCRAPSNAAARARENLEREARAKDLESTLATVRGEGKYDALVCVSGGKDSLLLLHRAVREYGLRVLAFTVELDLPDVALASIRRAVRALDVDHVVVRPSRGFSRKLFRYLLTHQEERGAVYTLSYVYAPLFESAAVRAAVERSIPLVLAGYSPGQPEPSRMLYEFSRELLEDTDWTPPALASSGAFDAGELSWFWDPRTTTRARIPRYLAPFHAWPYDQEAAMAEVAELGLVEKKRHASPIVSNYPINWLMMYSDLRSFGFNPYAPEFTALIREGKASRAYWAVFAPIVDAMIERRTLLGREVQRSFDWLGLSASELRITEREGAYDPVVGGLAGWDHERTGSGSVVALYG